MESPSDIKIDNTSHNESLPDNAGFKLEEVKDNESDKHELDKTGEHLELPHESDKVMHTSNDDAIHRAANLDLEASIERKPNVSPVMASPKDANRASISRASNNRSSAMRKGVATASPGAMPRGALRGRKNANASKASSREPVASPQSPKSPVSPKAPEKD